MGSSSNSGIEVNLTNFISYASIDLSRFYKYSTWAELNYQNDIRELGSNYSRVSRLKYINSLIYIDYLTRLLDVNLGSESLKLLVETQSQLANMVYFALFPTPQDHNSLFEGLSNIRNDVFFINEIRQLLPCLRNNILEVGLHNAWLVTNNIPLEVHCDYTREDILAAFGYKKFGSNLSSREGVLYLPKLNTDLFFVTLNKSDSNFSKTTMYKDYALSDTFFHWETQNATSPESRTGQRYINHKDEGGKFFLFVRESNKDVYGNTMPYVFLGEVSYVSHTGTRPMQVTLELEVPMPQRIFAQAAKYLPKQ